MPRVTDCLCIQGALLACSVGNSCALFEINAASQRFVFTAAENVVELVPASFVKGIAVPVCSATKLAQWQTDFTEGEDARQNVGVFAVDGSMLATGGSDGIVRVWRVSKDSNPRSSGAVATATLKNGNTLSVSAAIELAGHTKPIYDIAFCGGDKVCWSGRMFEFYLRLITVT
jgi:hypothetical protein